VDRVDDELLQLMKLAGCWMIGYGIESGSQDILDKNRKNITVKQVEDAVRLAKHAGLEVTGHVIFGLPAETIETGKATIKWLSKLDIDFCQFYCAVPWPSTALYKIAQQEGWLTTHDWKLYEQNNCVLDTGVIRPQDVEYLRRLAMRKFYLSPRRIFNVLKKLNSLKKIRVFFNMLKEFSDWV
jgi:radical SAM superfamily enzyme YgiQ (UPF0313 family)